MHTLQKYDIYMHMIYIIINIMIYHLILDIIEKFTFVQKWKVYRSRRHTKYDVKYNKHKNIKIY